MKVSTIKSIDEEDEFTLELREYEAQQKLFKQNNGKHQKDNQPIILN